MAKSTHRQGPSDLRPFFSYVLAIIAPLAMVMAWPHVEFLLGLKVPLLLLLCPVILSAWLGGIGPGVVAAIVAALSGAILNILEPAFPVSNNWTQESLHLATFLTIGLLISFFTGSTVRALCRERESRFSEQDKARKLNALLEGVKDHALFMLDTKGNVQTWNDSAERLFGYRWKEIAGTQLGIFYDQYAVLQGTPALQLALALKHGKYDCEEWRVRKDGSKFWAGVQLAPIRNDDGEIEGYAHIARDLTDRRKIEEELKNAVRNLSDIRSALDVSSIVATTDARGKITYVNQQFIDISGYEREELIGEDHRIINSGVHPKEFFRDLWRTIASGKVWHGEIRNRAKKGTLYWVDTTIVPFIDPNTQRPYQFIAVQNDITERKEAQDRIAHLLFAERSARSEAERANRLKDEFLATLSHELRGPLNAILGWTQILRKKKNFELPAQISQGLEVVERNARLQAQLIEDLLDTSRIVAGKVRLELQEVELGEIVSRAVDSARPVAESKGIGLEINFNGPESPVWADTARLHQIFWNLLTNAIKFTNAGGGVRVEISRREGFFDVRFRDTGVGIPTEFLPYVFDRFRQANGGNSRSHRGLGLGLAIVKHLTELHGGAVAVDSAGVGKGATFTVSLPLRRPDLPEQDPSFALHSAPRDSRAPESGCERLNGAKVLVVDDEEDARVLVCRVLEDCDANVRSAASAQEAMERIREDPPDVLLSDISMPQEDGYQFIQKVRKLPPEKGGNVPAAAITAFSRPEDRARALEAGFQMHLRKPLEPHQLISVVAELLPGAKEARAT